MIRRFVIAAALGTLLAIAAPAPGVRQAAAPELAVPTVALDPTERLSTPQIGVQSFVGEPDGCASMGEWDRLEPFLTRASVADLFGTSGWFLSDNGEIIRKGYDLCWTSTRFGVVRFDSVSGLSVSWRIRDR